ncbi:ABC transporter permease [Nonomuraea cavernae]|uniref:Uncharacterized protein n=1 Tax=Nonomuraea cavernae TaxID=2045107 RepID=A0A917YR21_9ACTN|nr:ABC transporter permease [Nonomuraea cavernae]MCA2184241.1 ABC transporter permease [Nonomuraea cavernae]GGO64409.1 hypothetical protein GCM10012289_13760 [Nonomuraea cavernae]
MRSSSLISVTPLPPAVAGFVLLMYGVATFTAGRRITRNRGWWWAGLPIAVGTGPVLALLLACGVISTQGMVIIPAAAQALVPALDQTRTVGLVTLPGVFVGMLLGGASPIEAGIVQLVVLVALLAAEAVATVVTIELAVRGHLDGGSPG